MKKRIIAGILSFAAGPVLAVPNINVGALNEYMQPGKSTLGKRVSNTGTSTAFVRVTVDEMIFNGGEYEEKPLNADALIKGQGNGLISSPARMIIPAKGQQTNRLVYTGARDKEKYFRVRYIPVIPENGSEFGMTSDEIKKYQSEINAGVTVLSGFGTIVTVMPANTKFNTSITENNKNLVITNNGNASIVISSLKECEVNLKKCSEATTKQLRPGMRLERKISQGKFWKYTLQEGAQKKDLTAGRS